MLAREELERAEYLSIRAEMIRQGLRQGLEQGLELGIEQGIEQGLQQGLEQGLARGRWEEFVSTVKQLSQSLPVEQIASLLSRPLAEVEQALQS